MPTFKPKSNKKIQVNKKTQVTLDSKHKEFLNDFTRDNNSIMPELKVERKNLREQGRI